MLEQAAVAIDRGRTLCTPPQCRRPSRSLVVRSSFRGEDNSGRCSRPATSQDRPPDCPRRLNAKARHRMPPRKNIGAGAVLNNRAQSQVRAARAESGGLGRCALNMRRRVNCNGVRSGAMHGGRICAGFASPTNAVLNTRTPRRRCLSRDILVEGGRKKTAIGCVSELLVGGFCVFLRREACASCVNHAERA